MIDRAEGRLGEGLKVPQDWLSDIMISSALSDCETSEISISAIFRPRSISYC